MTIIDLLANRKEYVLLQNVPVFEHDETGHSFYHGNKLRTISVDDALTEALLYPTCFPTTYPAISLLTDYIRFHRITLAQTLGGKRVKLSY